MKDGPYTGLRLGPNAPLKTLDDPSANGKAKTGSRIVVAVQAFEQTKNTFRLLLLEADPIVFYRYIPVRTISQFALRCRTVIRISGATSGFRYFKAFDSKF